MQHLLKTLLLTLTTIALSQSVWGQGPIAAPDREEGEGAGPFETLVIQNAIIIDGTGGPPRGPLTIVVKGNRIESIGRRSEIEGADHVIDASGMYVLPGFVDMHAHAGSSPKAPEIEYVYKLWMAHGVTTVRGVPLGSNDFTVREKQRSAANEIVAPRIFNYQRPGNITTIEEAQEWVRQAPSRDIDGLKLGAYPPEIMETLLDEANRLGLGSTAHLAQTGVVQMNAIDAARLGLGTVTHFYGHFESLLRDYVVQPYPVDHNYNNEQDRFSQVARLWNQIHPPGSEPWKAYLEEHLELGTTFDPTMNIYAAGRDVMRARNAEWHDQYTLPSLFQFFEPSLTNHGSYWFDWTTWDEVAWRNFYHVWMQLINDYKKMGGRVTVGSDSGFIYKTYGFGFIEELELLQEAGFHPLEVIQAATMNGALTLHEPAGKPLEFGIIRPGLLADLIIVPENPIANLKVLYGTGVIRLDEESGEVTRVGGVKWTIKDGIVYDAKQLLADVAAMVDEQKAQLSGAVAEESQTPETEATPQEEASDDQPDEQGTTDDSQPNDSQTIAALPPATLTTLLTPEQKLVTSDSGNQGSPDGTPEATMMMSDSLIIAQNHDQSTCWAYVKNRGEWCGVELSDDLPSTVPVVVGSVVWLKHGDSLYAFGASHDEWDRLTPIEAISLDDIETHSDSIIVRSENWLHVFSAGSGKWSSLLLGNELPESIR